jgi:hypothetical protein
MKEEHFQKTVNEIQDHLDNLTASFDGKILSAMLLNQTRKLFRALLTCGALSETEIRGMIEYSFAEATTKLPPEDMPQIISSEAFSKRAS